MTPSTRTGPGRGPGGEATVFLLSLLAVGAIARIVRYALGFALWEDECFVVVNLFEKGPGRLLGPLDFSQLAPPLWLLLEKGIGEAVGYSELSLRALALVSSLASLALFVPVARRLLGPREAALATGILAVSYPCVRYAAEVKPYAVDLLATTALLAVRGSPEEPPSRGRWALLGGLFLLLPWLSFPSVFASGAVVLVGARHALRRHRAGETLAWAAAGVLLLAGFVSAQAAIAGAAGPALPAMRGFWSEAFPPLATPWRLPLWLVDSLAGPLLAYPVGGTGGASSATAIVVVAGAVALLGSSRRALLGLCLAPFGLQLLAASLGRYPFGGHAKLSLYAAPFIAVLGGAGLALLAARLGERKGSTDAWMRAGAGLLLAIGALTVARDLARPYKNPSDEEARRFARSFWNDASRAAVPVDLEADLGVSFQPGLRSRLSWFATYRTGQILFSDRHRDRMEPDFRAVTRERPLLLVEYRVRDLAYDEEGLERWLRDLERTAEPAGEERVPVRRLDKRGRRLVTQDEIVLRRYVPRSGPIVLPPGPGRG